MNPLTVNLLQANNEHWAVRLIEDRGSDFDNIVRTDGEEESVEGGVMELAQG
jgi:hypothetical protein